MQTPLPPLNQVPASEEAVVWACSLILGRLPESAAIVRDHVWRSESLQALRERFLECSEFTQRYRVVERERRRVVRRAWLKRAPAESQPTPLSDSE